MGRDQRRDWTAVFVLVLLSIRPIVCNSLVPISCPYRSYSFLRTKGNSNDDHRPNEGPSEQPVSGFESLVRQVTGRSEYRFGDLTKNAVEDLAKATHLVDDDYHFGDITRSAVTSLSKPVEGALLGAERTLSLVREANIHELVALSGVLWSDNLNEEQRRQAWIVMIHLGAVAVLAYNCVSNVQAGMVAAAAWTRASVITGVSPLVPGHWSRFLQIQQTLDMIFGGPLLPARAIVTIRFFFPYRRWLVGWQRRSPLRQSYPLLNRVLSVLGMWVVVNLASVSLLTTAMIWFGSLWSRVPIWPSY